MGLAILVFIIFQVIVWARISTLHDDSLRMRKSLRALEEEIAALKARDVPPVARQQEADVSAVCESAAPVAAYSLPAKPPEPVLPVHPPVVEPAPSPAKAPPPAPARAAVSLPSAPRARPVPLEPTFLDRAFAAAKNWLFGGNTVLRVGVLLLFFGLAFLLRYASERVTLPIEFRYIGVGVAASALLALGWRLRLKNAVYGLTLQGAGISVLYLASFAAMRLHGLLPPLAAFGLLVLFTAAATVLAVLQDAAALACAAALGGFATPILVSTGSGDHVALFSYFALLNTGILLVAWFKAWRVLNLIGFVGTFGIGFAWGTKHYVPGLFGSTEPFLALFFFTYVCIGLLFARRKLLGASDAPEEEGRHAMLRWSAARTDYVDGSMMFGPPLIGFGLQCALVRDFYLGAAFSALGLGLFYLVMAYCLRGRKRIGLLMEICLALGVIFATLATPLAFDASGVVSAIWAVEGAGIYWLGLARRRRLPRAFSLALIAAAALVYLQSMGAGGDTLLAGSPMGAALLGGALLFCHRALRRTPGEALTDPDRASLPMLAASGLVFLYLIAPLCFGYEYTVIAWALAGLATVLAGLRLASRAFLACAFGVQLLGGLLFLCNLGAGETDILASGWTGLFRASLIGLILIASAIVVQNDAMARRNSALARRLGFVLLTGLLFINMALLFVLDWSGIGMGWAVSGLLLSWLGLWQGQRVVLYFGVALEAVAGVSFFFHAVSASLAFSGSWAPIVLALAAIAGAWRMHHVAARWTGGQCGKSSALAPERIGALSNLLLAWGMVWWVWAAVDQVLAFAARLDGGYFASLLHNGSAYAVLLAFSLSAALWQAVARRSRWRALALFACGLPLPMALWLLAEYGPGPFALGAPVWAVFFIVHLRVLRRLDDLLYATARSGAHVAGAWLFVGVAMLALHDVLAGEGGGLESAWPWLGWALAPSLYLWLASGERGRFWPFDAFSREYRFQAALPMALAMLAWFWVANALSSGNAFPLPYLPLLNPLELGLLLALLACWRWSRLRLPEAMAGVAAVAGGVSLLAFITMAVCRTAHAWGGMAFRADVMMASTVVQAGWSLVWSLFALALMIGGSRQGWRRVWMAGALLIAVVVAKLFFVELGNHGSLPRIVSFIGVGVLLLIVGYFSPLPPKAAAEERVS
jgi:uncharacterized membrane protein